jgi:hypothetical protein
MSFVERRGRIVWAVPPSRLSDPEIDGILADLEGHLAIGVPYVLLFDLTRAGMPNAVQRRRLANHVRDHSMAIRRSVRGLGVLLTSPVVRGMVTAIFWVAPPPVPYRLFSTRAEAVAWAESLDDEAARRPGGS